MSTRMFITAAPVGAVSRFVSPKEPKFLDNSELAAQDDSLESVLLNAGWKRVAAGGLRTRVNPEAGTRALVAVSATTLEWLESRKTQQDIVFTLTGSGWQLDNDGALVQDDPLHQGYLPPSLVEALRSDSPAAYETLISQGWEVCAAGYWNPMRAASPYLPITPDAIIEASVHAAAEGAAILHLHTRDLSDSHTLSIPGNTQTITLGAQQNHIDVDQYNQIVPALHQRIPSAIINLSTSVRGGRNFESPIRRAHLHHYGLNKRGPDVSSFSPGPVIFQAGGGYENSPQFLEQQLEHLNTCAIRPEVEVFNSSILDNALGPNLRGLSQAGNPILFMLVAGVDQFRRAEDGSVSDDSLIPVADREAVYGLIKQDTPASLAHAIELASSRLQPFVQRIRREMPDAVISILAPGPMLRILAEVALSLRLDGVRVGLEDALHVPDTLAPGGSRKATTADQVRYVRKRLEALGVSLQDAEQTRDRLNMPLDQVRLFREAAATLKSLELEGTPTAPRPIARALLDALQPLQQRYLEREAAFIGHVSARLAETLAGQAPVSAERLAEVAIETIFDSGLYVRYFIEERDRYRLPLNQFGKRLYAVQALNFIRELNDEHGVTNFAWDQALDTLATQDQLPRDSYRIVPHQYKGQDLRFLEYLASLPCRYNSSRTLVVNTVLRTDADYSMTMALLFEGIHQLTSRLRRDSSAERKAHGTRLYHVQAQDVQDVHATALPNPIRHYQWAVLPSTPTTNYSQGIALGKGLASTFSSFLQGIGQSSVALLGIVHSGLDAQDNPIIESAMLHNRFILGTQWHSQVVSHSARLIYEQVILPRIIAQPNALRFCPDGLVARDDHGLPLDHAGRPATRLSFQGIEDLQRLHFCAHSSGAATLQQLDNAMREDMQRLGYSVLEQEEIFNRAVAISFGSATDIDTTLQGTPVIDITAYNDIRSLAGTTTHDYIPAKACANTATIAQLNGGVAAQHRYDQASWAFYKEGKGRKLLRLKDVVLRHDPVRAHDGHSIRRYLEGAPATLHDLLNLFLEAPLNIRADMLMREFYATQQTTRH